MALRATARIFRVFVEQIAVGVRGHLGGAVAEHPLQRFDVRAGRDREARAGVTQLVRGQPGDADLLGRVVEPAAVERPVAKHRAGLRADEDMVRESLVLDMDRELLEDELRNRDRSLL